MEFDPQDRDEVWPSLSEGYEPDEFLEDSGYDPEQPPEWATESEYGYEL